MKTFLKMLVIALCCVFCITPFSVFAEEDTSDYSSYDEYLLDNSATFLSDVSAQASSFDNSQACVNFLELPYSQRQAIISLDTSSNGYNLVFLDSVGNVYAFRGAWTSSSDYTGGNITFYQTSDISNGGRYQVNSDGSLTKTSAATFTGVIESVFYWSQRYGGNDPFGTITFDGNLCQVTPPPTSTPFPTDDPFACNFALNEVISNDYVASLVAYAEKQNYSEPYYIYRVYYSDSADDMNILSQSGVFTELEPFSIKGYVLALEGYAYPQTYVLEYKQLRKLCTESSCAFGEFDLLDSMMYPFYELVLTSTCLEIGEFSEIQATQDVNASIQQTISQNATIISQNSSLIDNQNKTNDLIENGNSATDSILNNSSSILDSTNNSVDELVDFEDSLFNDISAGVNQFNSLTLPADFALSATFVRDQFQDIWNYSPLGIIISFCLMVGVISLIFGRKE